MSAAANDAKEMLGHLVGFDTTSAKSNLELIDFVAGYLDGLGIANSRVMNDDGDKANLLATIGPADTAGGVVLSGHTDVVPVTGQDWATDPFHMVERDGRLYGRGTCDMKGFIAAALALAPAFAKLRLARPIHLAFSYDEEVGCLGAPRLIEAIGGNLPACHAVIVGEPTSMKAVGAHRDVNVFTTRVTGRPAHASQPGEGADAIAAAARLMAFLADRADELAANPSPVEQEFDPPHANLNVGVVEGGTAVNIISGACSFSWGCRSATGVAKEVRAAFDAYVESEVLPGLRRTAPEAEIVTEFDLGIPPLIKDAASPAADLARELTGQNELGSVAFGTEAGLYAEAGIPTVILGPGSIRQAHTANEYLDVAQLDACVEFLERLGRWCAS